MGNWAEVTMDNGHISVTNFGRTADLAVNGDTEHWIRITSSPNFPDDTKLIADGYPPFGGHPVDGVFAMDASTVAALMKFTGPIDLPGELPALNDGDGLAVVVNNIGNNKIDFYLTGEVAYAVTTAPSSGTAKATLKITLRNSAPGRRDSTPIVFNNSEGAPPGSNMMNPSVVLGLVRGVRHRERRTDNRRVRSGHARLPSVNGKAPPRRPIDDCVDDATSRAARSR
jgi:hypothetical protein